MTLTADVLVIGSGAAGLSAATTAALLGFQVIVVEKTRWFGGTTALSGGGIWIPNNPQMAQAGLSDDRAAAANYVNAVCGADIDRTRMDAFLNEAPAMVKFFEAQTQAIRFISATFLPDYEPKLAGARFGRTLAMPDIDADALGKIFARLRPPLAQMTVLAGMQVGGEDIEHLLNRWRSAGSFRHVAKRVIKHAGDLLRSGRGRRLTGGNAVAARLLRAAIDSGVTLIPQAPALRLLERNGRVIGAIVNIDGREVEIAARKGVVLAAGGYGGNAEFTKTRLPFPQVHRTMLPEGNTGDGIGLAAALGCAIGADLANNAVGAPLSVLQKKDGTSVAFPHILLDRSRPGSIVVNRAGRRFVNEATHYHGFVEAMHRTGSVPAWLIANAQFMARYGLGLAQPHRRKAPFIAAGYLATGSAADIAKQLGIDAAGLGETIAQVNREAPSGTDTAFGRGESVYDQIYGDANHLPNPNFGPLGDGPYYAITLIPGDLGTSVGLMTDEKARVLRGGAPVPGLYAAGLDMHSIMNGRYPGAGSMIGPAMTFGYIAARDACAPQDAASLDSPAAANA